MNNDNDALTLYIYLIGAFHRGDHQVSIYMWANVVFISCVGVHCVGVQCVGDRCVCVMCWRKVCVSKRRESVRDRVKKINKMVISLDRSESNEI